MEMQRSDVENASKVVDKVFKAHENGAAFYEKLILFDVGTIALSLTLLGQIVAHTPGGHVPRHPFLWFLCPAWFLLLVSIQCCTQRIVGFHNANILLVQQMSTLVSENQMRHLSVIIARLSTAIGEITLGNEHAQQPQFSTFLQGDSEHKPQTLAAVFSNMNEALGKELQKGSGKADELVQRALQSDTKTGVAARIGIFATTVALVLICIFAVESILHI
jgi:hypothetical protein